MNPRKFNKESFDMADSLAKDTAVRLFSYHPQFRAAYTEDYYRDDLEAMYKIDLVIIDRQTSEHTYGLEVEVKSDWKSNSDFPFHDVHFLPRKFEKWTDPKYTYGKPVHWIMFNQDGSRHLIVFDDDIRALHKKKVVNCRQRGPEELFVVDHKAVYFDYL